jgi:citrate lyase beta subunit
MEKLPMTLELSHFVKAVEHLEHDNLKRQQIVEELRFKRAHEVQPMHVLYGGAQLFTEKTLVKIPDLVRTSFRAAASDAGQLNQLIGEQWSEDFSDKVYDAVSQKLSRLPVEDFRIDFEDGYGVRTEEQEDLDAVRCAEIAANIHNQSNAHSGPLLGFRVKALGHNTYKRSLKTLLLFLNRYCATRENHQDQKLSLAVTLPKVVSTSHVELAQEILASAESTYGFPHGFFHLELLIESCDGYFRSRDGGWNIVDLIRAGKGRVSGLHFGVYDFHATMGIAPSFQDLHTNAGTFAKTMLLFASGLCENVRVSDGVINVLPIRKPETTPDQFQDLVRYNYQRMRQTLEAGIFQSWDVHPSQVWIRTVAHIAFLLKDLPSILERLTAFEAAQHTAIATGSTFDDRASILGLLQFARRAASANLVSI